MTKVFYLTAKIAKTIKGNFKHHSTWMFDIFNPRNEDETFACVCFDKGIINKYEKIIKDGDIVKLTAEVCDNTWGRDGIKILKVTNLQK